MKWFKKKFDWTYHPINPIETNRDMTGAFAIEDTHPLWLAMHQTINEVEKEIIETARNCSANPSLSNYHLGASEGAVMVRRRMIDKRKIALDLANQLTQQHASKIR